MYDHIEIHVPKQRVRVELRMLDGTVHIGEMFVTSDQRTLDILNDRRPFLPLELGDGEVVLLSKSTIAQVRPFDSEQPGLRQAPIPLAHPRRSDERRWRA